MAEPDELALDLSRCWRELGRTLMSRRLLASLQAEASSPLTPTKLHALDVLAERGDVRTSELARSLSVDETSATRLVDRLEQAGLVARRAQEGDRRVTLVSLTPAGGRLVGAIAERRRQFFSEVLASLEPDERAELVRLTVKATAALRARSEELVRR
jgi:DNA-binding MarR family transcriptional regulator